MISHASLKKFITVVLAILQTIFLFAQELQHDAVAINIEVPVRVFTKGKFVEELNLKDFQVYEDGVLQKVEALYLIKKTVIDREETELDKKSARRIYLPEASRTFVLAFEMMDYFPKIEETLKFFFNNVFQPDDSLYIMTPRKTYSLKQDLFEKTPKEIIVEKLKSRLVKDITLAASPLKRMIRELESMAPEIEMDQSGSVMMAAQMIMRQIRDFRYLDEKKLMEFRDQLKNIEGQKHVFLFYQKKLIAFPSEIPVPDDVDRAWIGFDVDKIKKAFSDSLISVHFIFATKTDHHRLDVIRMNPSAQRAGVDPSESGLRFLDQSEEIFGAFYDMAKATGGIAESSANIASAFERAAIASENYYLLYYTPQSYKADGKFRNIKVKVKGKNYRVTHRAGYIAD